MREPLRSKDKKFFKSSRKNVKSRDNSTRIELQSIDNNKNSNDDGLPSLIHFRADAWVEFLDKFKSYEKQPNHKSIFDLIEYSTLRLYEIGCNVNNIRDLSPDQFIDKINQLFQLNTTYINVHYKPMPMVDSFHRKNFEIYVENFIRDYFDNKLIKESDKIEIFYNGLRPYDFQEYVRSIKFNHTSEIMLGAQAIVGDANVVRRLMHNGSLRYAIKDSDDFASSDLVYSQRPRKEYKAKSFNKHSDYHITKPEKEGFKAHQVKTDDKLKEVSNNLLAD